jgi:hypothetical protein
MKPIICVGQYTIKQLMAGKSVEIETAIIIPADDLNEPESGEHQEILDAIERANTGEEG